ncbi:MAG: cyclodeaminase/cyclohydrolase family protein [Chloroflexota bacterium]|nr:cyclodeaminase/cyclohydrolase family protein [Chloroflexota bacterium]
MVADPLPDRFGALSLDAFIERLASSDPVPGGGSASAVVGSVAAALVSMVTDLSTGRPRYADYESMYPWTGSEGSRLSRRLLALADDDARAYGGFAAARKLPRDTDAEREARTVALQVAARAASEAPLECVAACRDVVAAAEALAGRSNVNAASDVLVAALLGEAAAAGAAANVRINLPSVGDDTFATEMTERVDELLHDVARLAARAREVVVSGEIREPLLEVAAS